MGEFQFKRDFKYVDWKRTLLVNLMRSAAADIMWAILYLIQGHSTGESLMMILAFPFGYLLFLLPFGLFCAFLSSMGVPWVGLVTMFVGIFIVPGDPLVYAMHKAKPELVPVKEYGFFNFVLIIYVINEELQKAELGSLN